MKRPSDISFKNEVTKAYVDIEVSQPHIPEEIASGFEDIDKVNYKLSDNWTCNQADFIASYPCFFEWQRFNISIGVPSECVNGKIKLFINGIENKTNPKFHNDFVQINTNYKFENAVGLTSFEIRDSANTETLFKFETEIFPQKLDYKNDYKLMMDEVTSIIYNLAFDFLQQTHSLGLPKDSYNKTLNEFIAILKVIYNRLEKSIDQILRNPKSKIEQLGRVREVSQVKKIVKRPDRWIQKNRQFISTQKKKGTLQIGKDLYVSHLPEQKKRVSYDTFENQFVLWAIKDIISKIDDTISSIKSSDYQKAKGIEDSIHELEQFQRRLRFRTNDQYFKEVSDFDLNFHFSTTLTMAPGYKDFYIRYLLLNKGLSLADNDIFKIDLKNIATLYEYWCFLKIVDTLKENKKYDFESSDLLKVEHKKFVVNLKKGINSNITLHKKSTGEKISIGYNREFRPPTENKKGIATTFTQIPDNIIEFSKVDYDEIGQVKKPFKYILDAKYRFDKPSKDADPEDKNSYNPPQDAIGQLHRYRDAMLWQTDKDGSYKKVIRNLGGAILFPYPKDEELFKESKYYKSLSTVNIGAVPLRPGSPNKLFESFLDDLFDVPGDELMESVIDFDKTPLLEFEEKVRIPALIGMIREKDNKERLKFFEETGLFYIREIKNPNEQIFNVKRVAIYNQATNKIIGTYKVNKQFFQTPSKYKQSFFTKPESSYLFFELELDKSLDIEFTLNDFGSYYFFTNTYALDKFAQTKDKSYLKLNTIEDFKKVRQLRSKGIEFEVKRIGDFKIDESNRDISEVGIEIISSNRQ